MSNWASEASNDENIMNPDLMWKVKVKAVDDNLRKLKQEADNMSEKFIWVKSKNGSFEGFQNWIHKMTDSCKEVTSNIDILVKMKPKGKDMESITKSNQVKQLSKRVEIQIKHIQNLSSDIQKEMERRFVARKMESSFVSNSTGEGDGRQSDGSMQMATLEDPQVQQAIEEEKQCAKLLTDIVQLEGMFCKMSSMIHDQGEMVDSIHANVEDAFEKVEEGNKQLKQAEEYKGAAMRKKLCIIGIVVIVLAVLALIIGLSIKYGG